MTITLRRLLALGIVLSLVAAFAAGAFHHRVPDRPSETEGNPGSASIAALAIGVSGLLAHRRRRAR